MSNVFYNVGSFEKMSPDGKKLDDQSMCSANTKQWSFNSSSLMNVNEPFFDTSLMNGNLTVYSVMALERADCHNHWTQWEKLMFNFCVEII